MEFTERSELERGFAAVYRDRVRPALAVLEERRIARLRKAWMWVAVVAAVTVAVVAFLIWAGTGEWPYFVGAFLALVGGMIGYMVWQAQAMMWNEAVEGAVMPAICEHIGDLSYDGFAGDDFPLEALAKLGVVGSFQDSYVSDELKGRYRDTGFEMVEARLTRQSRSSDGGSRTKTVFRGLLFHIEVPVEAPGRILIGRDYGAVSKKLGSLFAGDRSRGMVRVEMGHSGFEKAFEVYAGDPVAAKKFMPVAFLDSLMAIGTGEGGKRGTGSMVAGFEGRSFYLALSRGGDFLQMGSLTTPVADMEEDLHEIFDDIGLVRRIIDRLHGG
ncbi:DUF3137 domain-containing protein [Pseudoruegeria sp. HB172150]|uniref:DUF3137 domain-containing protein n=1 Tax=Pseudoruegeria sp. HB172150 TaxID=2721164 RepID=UPI001557F238|nr:DUF3137 domain-containing protein [Pseudoruegeria sp. HB172150]